MVTGDMVVFGDMQTKEQKQIANRRWYLKNRERIILRSKVWSQNNPSKSLEIKLRWLKNNPQKRLQVTKKYREAHRDYPAKWRRRKRSLDLNFKLECNLRNRVYCALRRENYSRNTLQLLGCPLEDFWMYLESRFQEGMTRENYGKVWHIDHIMPCAIFDLTREDHRKRCFHFSNLQPLFGKENQRKSAKVITNQFNLL